MDSDDPDRGICDDCGASLDDSETHICQPTRTADTADSEYSDATEAEATQSDGSATDTHVLDAAETDGPRPTPEDLGIDRRNLLKTASTLPLFGGLPALSGVTAGADGFVSVRGINAGEYPTIETTCIVETDAGRDGDLSRGAFTLEEEGSGRSIDDFEVIQIDRSGEPEPLDIVFVFDDTGSMGPYIDAMQDAVTDFIDDLEAANVDGRYGLVSFKQNPDNIDTDRELTSDAGAVQDAVNALSATGGGPIPENPLDAIDLALSFDFRTEARDIVITITDAPARHGNDNERDASRGTTELTLADIREGLVGTTFIAISPTDGQISSYLPPEGSFMNVKRIAEQVDGFWLELPPDNIFEEFQARLETIQETLAATRYILTYDTPLPEDGELRTVRCTVDDPAEGTDDDTGEYRPPGFVPGLGVAVSIERTNAPVSAGETLSVEVRVENLDAKTGVLSVSLDTDGLSAFTPGTTFRLDSEGEVATKTIEVETEPGDEGSYTLVAEGDGKPGEDTDSETIEVGPGEGGEEITVTGTVRDDADNALADATVAFVEEDAEEPTVTATTDEAGAYTVDVPAPAVYEVTASKSGFAPATQTLSTDDGEEQKLDFVLADVSVLGTVTNALGDPLSGITVEARFFDLEGGEGDTVETTETDENGQYGFSLGPGRYEIVVEEADFESVGTPIAVEFDETKTVDIELVPEDATIAISTVEVGPSAQLRGADNDAVFFVGVEPESGSSVDGVEVQRVDSTFPGESIEDLGEETLCEYLGSFGIDVTPPFFGCEDVAESPVDLLLAAEGVVGVPASQIYAVSVPSSDLVLATGDNKIDVFATASDGTFAVEEVSLPNYAQGDRLRRFETEAAGPTVDFSQEYFAIDIDLAFSDPLIPVNLPIDVNIEIFRANLGYTGQGDLDLNTLDATAVDRSTGGISIFGKGVEFQIGGTWEGNPVGYTYELEMVDLWLAGILTIPIPVTKLNFKLPDNPVIEEVGVDVEATPSGYMLFGDTDVTTLGGTSREPALPALGGPTGGLDTADVEVPIPETRELNQFHTLSGSAGVDVAEAFVDGNLHAAQDIDIRGVFEPPTPMPLATQGGEVCLDGGIAVGKDPVELVASLGTIADITPGFSEPCLALGETREPPCWEVFGADEDCAEYPSAATATADTLTFDASSIEDAEIRLVDPAGSHPPEDVLTPETDTGTVTRLTDRPERDGAPAVAARDDTHLVAWERQFEDASAEFGRDIVTAVRDSAGTWSDPTRLTDEAGASYHGAAVGVSGGDAALAWTRYDIDGVEELEDIGTTTRIEFVPEQANGWGDPVVVADTGDWFDSDPAIEPLGDGWVVAWERRGPDDPSTRAVGYAVVDADGSVERTETIDDASDLDLDTDATSVVLGYHARDASEVRRDLVTEGGRTEDAAYPIAAERSLRDLAVSGVGTVWLVVDRTKTGFYAEGDDVEELEFVADLIRMQALGLQETAAGTVLTYTRAPETDVRARSLAYRLRGDGEWLPEQVAATADAESDIVIRRPAIAPATDGEGLVSVLGTKAHNPDAVTDLFAVDQPFRPSYAISAEANQPFVPPGEDLTVSYTIENTGDLDGDAIGTVPVSVEARSQGVTLAAVTESPLDRGETATGELTFGVDETGTVDVVVGRELDLLNPTERRTTIEASTPLLEPGSVTADRPDAGTVVATVPLRNYGPIDAPDFGIELYAGDGSRLAEASVDGPAAGERTPVTVEFDPGDIDIARGEELHIDPDGELPDSYVPREVSSVLLGRPDITVSDDIAYSETGSGVVAELTVTNEGPIRTQALVSAVRADATPEDGTFDEADVFGTAEFDLPAAVGGTPADEQVTVPLEGVEWGAELRFVVESARSVAGAGIPVVRDRAGPFTESGSSPLLEYTNDEGIVDTAGLREAISDWRANDIDTSVLRDAIAAWRSGDPV
ncbi:MAG: carboxypeptidase regulatory-like domain-containing protein [Halovenus sp.]